MSAQTEFHAHAVRPGEGNVLIPDRAFLRLSSRGTGGAFEVIELSGLDGEGPPPHIHHNRHELFYVLQGRAEFTLGEESVTVEAGSLVFVPQGTRHAFKLGPDTKLLGFIAPAGLEGFFKDLGAAMAAGTGQQEIRHALEAKYDSHPA